MRDIRNEQRVRVRRRRLELRDDPTRIRRTGRAALLCRLVQPGGRVGSRAALAAHPAGPGRGYASLQGPTPAGVRHRPVPLPLAAPTAPVQFTSAGPSAPQTGSG